MTGAARRFAVVVTAVALGLATVAAPATAADDEPTAKQWAKGVCSSVRTWFDAVEGALMALEPRGSLGDSIANATEGIADATRTLVHDLDDVGLPPVQHGKQAKAALRKLGDRLEQDLHDAADTLRKAGEHPSIAGLLTGISDVLGKALRQVAATTRTLKRLDPDGELRTALERTPACTMLRDTV
jgi:hypothetical protein